MRVRKASAPPAVVARRLYLSPAGLSHVRTKVTPADRDRLDGMLAADTLRIITTTKES